MPSRWNRYETWLHCTETRKVKSVWNVLDWISVEAGEATGVLHYRGFIHMCFLKSIFYLTPTNLPHLLKRILSLRCLSTLLLRRHKAGKATCIWESSVCGLLPAVPALMSTIVAFPLQSKLLVRFLRIWLLNRWKNEPWQGFAGEDENSPSHKWEGSTLKRLQRFLMGSDDLEESDLWA